jgi:hypothetical protein
VYNSQPWGYKKASSDAFFISGRTRPGTNSIKTCTEVGFRTRSGTNNIGLATCLGLCHNVVTHSPTGVRMIKISYTKHLKTGILTGFALESSFTVPDELAAAQAAIRLQGITELALGTDIIGNAFWVDNIKLEEILD